MTDRLRSAFVGLLQALLPELPFYVRWEYRVTGVNPGPPVTVSGDAVSPACPMPSLATIALWRGSTGSYAVPAVGSTVLIEFHEGSPAKPAVCGMDPTSTPTTITLGAGTDPIALSLPTDAAISQIVTAFNTHTHVFVATGAVSPTNAPLPQVQPAPGSVASTLPVVSQ